MYFYAYWDECPKAKRNFIKKCKRENLRFKAIDCETKEGVELSCKYQVRMAPAMLVVENGEKLFTCCGQDAISCIDEYLSSQNEK